MKSEESMTGFAGKTLEQLRQEFPEISRDAELCHPWWKTQAESFEDVRARVEPLIAEVLASGENTLLMGHGASTEAAVSILLGRTGHRFNSYMPYPTGGNSNISEFRYTNGKLVPVRLLSVSHLPATLMTSNYRHALNKGQYNDEEFMAGIRRREAESLLKR